MLEVLYLTGDLVLVDALDDLAGFGTLHVKTDQREFQRKFQTLTRSAALTVLDHGQLVSVMSIRGRRLRHLKVLANVVSVWGFLLLHRRGRDRDHLLLRLELLLGDYSLRLLLLLLQDRSCDWTGKIVAVGGLVMSVGERGRGRDPRGHREDKVAARQGQKEPHVQVQFVENIVPPPDDVLLFSLRSTLEIVPITFGHPSDSCSQASSFRSRS